MFVRGFSATEPAGFFFGVENQRIMLWGFVVEKLRAVWAR